MEFVLSTNTFKLQNSMMTLQIRLVGVLFLSIATYLIVTIIVKYIYISFVMFCVMYTCTDLYKKRKRFTWVWWIGLAYMRWVSTFAFGKDYIEIILSSLRKPKSMKSMKSTNSTVKSKKKI